MPANKKYRGHGKVRARKKQRRKTTVVRRESNLEIIDRLLLALVQTTINGTPTRIPVVAAIAFQLLQKELIGDARAGRALLKYQERAKRDVRPQVNLEFADSDYTRLLAADPPESGHD